MISSGLFSEYSLDERLRQDAAWSSVSDQALTHFVARAGDVLAGLPASGNLAEAETEALIVFPILDLLGWLSLPQQKAGQRREDIPDALLFPDGTARQHALSLPAGVARWRHASVVNENQAWDLTFGPAVRPGDGDARFPGIAQPAAWRRTDQRRAALGAADEWPDLAAVLRGRRPGARGVGRRRGWPSPLS